MEFGPPARGPDERTAGVFTKDYFAFWVFICAEIKH